jgi:hypothetical protein
MFHHDNASTHTARIMDMDDEMKLTVHTIIEYFLSIP